ncbi:MAG: hypothetical protein SNH79_03695 [Rikenellaceae bacterium]
MKIARLVAALYVALLLGSCADDYRIYYYMTLTNMSQNAADNIYLTSHVAALISTQNDDTVFYGTEVEASEWFNEKCDLLEAEDFAPSASVLEDSTGTMNLISSYETVDYEAVVLTREIIFFATAK